MSDEIKKILVVGGAGFIGSHFTAAVLKEYNNAEVVVLDNFSSGTQRHLNEVRENSRLTIFTGDLKDLDWLKNMLRGVDLVAHFAANPNIAAAVEKPDIDFWEGTYLTQNLLEAVRVNKVKFMLYTSGSGIYGESTEPFAESYGPCLPISTYGASKLACEGLISAYCHMFGLRARAFRFANVVGPNQTHGVGYDFIRKLNSNPEILEILGDGSQTKSYIHVDDVLKAMLLVLKRMVAFSEASFDVFNVATDDYVSVREIAEIANRIAQTSATLSFGEGPRGWPGDVPIVKFNVEKIKGLGWQTTYSASQAIESSLMSMMLALRGEKNFE